LTAAEEMVGEDTEQQRRHGLRRLPQHRPDSLGPPPQTRVHDVEPARIERRVERRQAKRRAGERENAPRHCRHDQRRHEEDRRAGERGRAHVNAADQVVAVDEPVTQPAREQGAGDRERTEDQGQAAGEPLTRAVLPFDELDAERPRAGEEEIAGCAGDDEHNIRADAQHVTERASQRPIGWVVVEHQIFVRLDRGLRGARLRLTHRHLARGITDASAPRFRQPPHQHRQNDSGQRQRGERHPPADGRQTAGDCEPEPGPDELASEDIAPDAATLAGFEVVTDEARRGRCRDRDDSTKRAAQTDKLCERPRTRRHRHDDGPPDHADRQQARAVDPVDQPTERDGRKRADQAGHRSDETDVGVAEVQRSAYLRRARAYRRLVRARQTQDARKKEQNLATLATAYYSVEPLDPRHGWW
jgi:hypothetical protein